MNENIKIAVIGTLGVLGAAVIGAIGALPDIAVLVESIWHTRYTAHNRRPYYRNRETERGSDIRL